MSIDEPIPPSVSSEDLETCIRVLEKVASHKAYSQLESTIHDRLQPVLHSLFHIQKRLKRKRLVDHRAQLRQTDTKAKNSCLLRAGRAEKLQQLQLQHVLVPDGTVPTSAITSSNGSQRLLKSIPCYICKLKFRTLHFFYDSLCPSCAALNFSKRNQTSDLSKRIALVTGGRLKIGYRIVLKLLRANCFVIATSRFPIDFLNRLNKERDFDEWKSRIHIYAVDFRCARLIEEFTQMIIEKYDRLDFLINNACQTIQRPQEFYQHLVKHERLASYALLPLDQQTIVDGNLQFYKQLFPFSTQFLEHAPTSLPISSTFNDSMSSSLINTTSFDVNNQLIDFRPTNSWMLRLADLSSIEVAEVLSINTLAPFILNSKLKVLMVDKHPESECAKFIINVSAMEGSFSRKNKTSRHPHTNAAKAALNMMTRTSASDYKKSNIYMVSVDTGWINDEKPLGIAYKTMIERDFQTPLDEEDAAARVLDPIIDTYRQVAEGKTDINIPYGCFLKDYQKCDW
ncbi:unnamed protein product [Adineta ricciae]|uniref:Oxidoreductase n=1 Tax=Adineta ricciae TaxID=249248 RepID=A0A814K756_ADIRI|nr:unnamed protein product [Adineta ricciae]CAF1544337.1 unnamed protein product [Adineta ricciae]